MKIIVEAKPHETVSIASEGQERCFSEKELVEALVGSWYSAFKKTAEAGGGEGVLEFPDRALIKSSREHADSIIKQLSDDGVTLREAILIAKRMDHVLMKTLERDPDIELNRLLNL